jgi:hypothetical protein
MKNKIQKKSRREEILKLIEKSDSFIVIFHDHEKDEMLFAEHNISNGDVILGCETVKTQFLKKVCKC